MFKGQPKGLFALALANTGERFGYYTMLAVFALFLRENFGLEAGTAGAIYSTFLGLVYFMPLVGGILADKFGFGRMVTIGISVMFVGYLLLSVPLGGNTIAMIAMLAALLLISLGTGLFKGNLQVMVGNLYDDPKYADKRDAAFSLFYMAINIGALFAPTAAVKIKSWAETSLGFASNDAYHFSFAVACAALVLSIAIYYAFRPTFRHVEGGERKKGDAEVVDTLKMTSNLAKVDKKEYVGDGVLTLTKDRFYYEGKFLGEDYLKEFNYNQLVQLPFSIAPLNKQYVEVPDSEAVFSFTPIEQPKVITRFVQYIDIINENRK